MTGNPQEADSGSRSGPDTVRDVETSTAGTGSDVLGVQATLSEALGTAHRADPVLPRSGGPAGNARLTAWLGLTLFVLLALEGLTLLDIHGLVTWHIVIGALLVPPALVKTATTGWRIVRYYAGSPAYRTAGPPPMALRLLGPLVMITTLAVLGTGILVGVLGPASATSRLAGTPVSALLLHQATFVVWFAVMTLHVLGRFVPALRIVSGKAVAAARVDGRLARIALLLLTAAAAVLAAVLIRDASASWLHPFLFGFAGH